MANSSVLSYHSGCKGHGKLRPEFQPRPQFSSQIVSISTALLQHIDNYPNHAEVVGWFRRAVNILVDASMVALVLPVLGNGPFHIVVEDLPPVKPTQPVCWRWDEHKITLGEWAFHFTERTQYWEARPAWEQLQIQHGQLLLLQECVAHILAQKTTWNAHAIHDIRHILTTARIDDFWHCLRNENHTDFMLAVGGIIGRGPGLTPTGDDFLAGFMLSLWTLHHPKTEKICRWIVDASHQRTTHISIAYLKAIAAGCSDERWHQFIYALDISNRQLLFSTIANILAFGASSGSDMLYGFMWGIEFQQHNTKPVFI